MDIAFVNNMPDSAFHAAERQFRASVQAAAGRMDVQMHRFALAGVPRSEEMLGSLAGAYGTLDDLLGRSFDAVIVTGNEPLASRLDLEPYWRDLTRLVDWADLNTASSLWSCLAAHAAVLHMHGIQRRPLPAKLSGVFEFEVDIFDPLLTNVSHTVAVPHSRLNELCSDDLVAHGYKILSRSHEGGVDLFTLQKRSRFVFLQGHPEYETDTLLREYRRDVGRFLRGERSAYPPEPANYFSAEALSVLRAFRRRSAANRDPRLFEVFPNVASPFAVTNRWQHSTLQFYRNWLGMVASQKTLATAAGTP